MKAKYKTGLFGPWQLRAVLFLPPADRHFFIDKSMQYDLIVFLE